MDEIDRQIIALNIHEAKERLNNEIRKAVNLGFTVDVEILPIHFETGSMIPVISLKVLEEIIAKEADDE